MNTFTKVLVVIVLILSLGFAASQMVLHAQRQNASEAISRLQSDLQSAQQAAQDAQGKLRDVTETKERQIDTLQTQVTRLEGEVEGKQAALTEARTNLQEAQDSVKTLTTTNQGLNEQLTARRGQIATLEKKVDQLQDEVEQKVAKVEGLTKTLQARNSQIAQLQNSLTDVKKERQELALSTERMEQILQTLRARGVEVGVAYVPPINGSVISVDRETRVAILNRGSQDGVKQNTEFTIYRDGDFVAKAIVMNVEPDVAIARATLTAPGKDMQVGDNATTEIR